MSSNSKEKRVTALEDDLQIEDIHGFVTCSHEEQWWVGCVIHVDEDTLAVTISILQPHGPSSSFRFPAVPNVVNITLVDCELYAYINIATYGPYLLNGPLPIHLCMHCLMIHIDIVID